MKAHLRYLSYVIRHKWFVLVAGRRTGAPLWRLLIHDWSKFLPSEWFAYVRNFYGLREDAWRDREASRLMPSHGFIRAHAEESAAHAWCDEHNRRRAAFDRAWLHHQHANPHHWQHWLLVNDNPDSEPSYHITSPDGVGQYLSLTEYVPGWRERDEQPVHVDLDRMSEAEDPGNLKYKMLCRLTRRTAERRPVPLPMPDHFVREMVADWMGAGRAITGRWEVAEWYAKNRGKMVLHPLTRARVDALIAEVTE